MSKIYHERRTVSPWAWTQNSLKSIAIRASADDTFDPQCTTMHFDEYVPGADLEFEFRVELDQTALTDNLDLCIWKFCRVATEEIMHSCGKKM